MDVLIQGKKIDADPEFDHNSLIMVPVNSTR
jgi:hypothetical protein